MARTALSIQTYNRLYGLLRGSLSGRGVGFTINAFACGSAVITVIVHGGNVVVNLNAIITTVYENDELIGYRVSDENVIHEVKNLSQAAGHVRRIVNEARIILNKVK